MYCKWREERQREHTYIQIETEHYTTYTLPGGKKVGEGGGGVGESVMEGYEVVSGPQLVLLLPSSWQA